MRYNSTYNLHTTKQLIDINQSIKNFKAKVKIQSQNQDDKFYVLVVTSDDLDDDLDDHYKEVKHEVTINLETDDQQPNSDYVLIMKSPNLIKVNVNIDLIDLNDTTQNSNTSNENFEIQPSVPKKTSYLGMFSKFLTKRNMMIIAVLIIGVLIYFFVIKKKKTATTNSFNMESNQPTIQLNPSSSSNDSNSDNRLKFNIESESDNTQPKGDSGNSVLHRLQELTNSDSRCN